MEKGRSRRHGDYTVHDAAVAKYRETHGRRARQESAYERLCARKTPKSDAIEFANLARKLGYEVTSQV